MVLASCWARSQKGETSLPSPLLGVCGCSTCRSLPSLGLPAGHLCCLPPLWSLRSCHHCHPNHHPAVDLHRNLLAAGQAPVQGELVCHHQHHAHSLPGPCPHPYLLPRGLWHTHAFGVFSKGFVHWSWRIHWPAWWDFRLLAEGHMHQSTD